MLVFLICKSRASIAVYGTPIQKLMAVGKWTYPPVFEVEKFRSALEKIRSRHAYTVLHADDVSKPLHPKLWRWSDSEKPTSPLFLSHSKTPKTKCQSSPNSQQQQSYESSAHRENGKIAQCSLQPMFSVWIVLDASLTSRKSDEDRLHPIRVLLVNFINLPLSHPTIHLHPHSCHSIWPRSRPPYSLITPLTSPLQWRGPRLRVCTGTYQIRNRFFNLQPPFSPLFRPFFAPFSPLFRPLPDILPRTLPTQLTRFCSFPTHCTPPFLLHLPPSPYSHLYHRVALLYFLFCGHAYLFVQQFYTSSNFVFILRLTLLGFAHYPMLARHLALAAHPCYLIS